ncbi:hypothetical protein [uncultured Leclercia sp.]|uniref:hypothetical protein n=1 Tax=uncultured Leclercia sp. TaxID=332959 RepID=UPI0025941789|nr:hypothetical protein [uncultured Leclercia sp.]
MLSPYKKTALLKTTITVIACWSVTGVVGFASTVEHPGVYESPSAGLQGNSHHTFKPFILRAGGIPIEYTDNNELLINGHAAAPEETGPAGSTYTMGRYRVIFNERQHTAELTEDGAFVGWGE